MLWISFDFYIFAKGSSTTVTIAEAIVQHLLLFVKRQVRHCHGAQAGSFLLEFGMLSVLSGQSRFYNAAKRSLLAFWSASDVSRGQSSTVPFGTQWEIGKFLINGPLYKWMQMGNSFVNGIFSIAMSITRGYQRVVYDLQPIQQSERGGSE
jgi:hypothetical protein